MEPDGLLEPSTAERLRRARSGEEVARRLRVADLEVGDVGILEAVVRTVSPVRSYNRKRGGEGLLCRVTLEDGSGEVDLVLWDDEARLAKDGPFRAGSALRIAGATVRTGWKGGIELSLGDAEVTEAAPPSAASVLEGVLRSLAEAEAVGSPPAVRFRAEAVVETPAGPVRIVAWDALLLEMRRRGVGAPVALEGVAPHPFLDGWWVAGPGARLRNG
ncbi:MAG TPA: OB-fold nucleic acid binding domain-containing protein [Candidatus Thermoplasmatota archaeon]|nr:OB-fold nucleic acid binding domain-containing protein [Candidatus Thermoplasmatota archaeon]